MSAEFPFSVAHVTMGIQEDDWERAIDFADAGVGGVLTAECYTQRARGCREGGAAEKSGEQPEGEEEEMQVVATETPLPGRGFRFGIGLHPWCVVVCGVMDVAMWRVVVVMMLIAAHRRQ